MSQLTDLFSDIADAIRGKTGESAAIKAADFPTAIAGITVGENWTFGTVTSSYYSTRALQSDLLKGADEFYLSMYGTIDPGSYTDKVVITASKVNGEAVGVYVRKADEGAYYYQGENYVSFDATTGTITLNNELDSRYIFYARYNVAVRQG